MFPPHLHKTEFIDIYIIYLRRFINHVTLNAAEKLCLMKSFHINLVAGLIVINMIEETSVKPNDYAEIFQFDDIFIR